MSAESAGGLESRLRETAALLAVARVASATTDFGEALRLICRELARLTGAETVVVLRPAGGGRGAPAGRGLPRPQERPRGARHRPPHRRRAAGLRRGLPERAGDLERRPPERPALRDPPLPSLPAPVGSRDPALHRRAGGGRLLPGVVDRAPPLRGRGAGHAAGHRRAGGRAASQRAAARGAQPAGHAPAHPGPAQPARVLARSSPTRCWPASRTRRWSSCRCPRWRCGCWTRRPSASRSARWPVA